MDPADTASVQLDTFDVHLLLEGLDAYEYWQLGDSLPRNNGMVFLPEDPFADRYWPHDHEPSESQVEAIDAVRECRALVDRLNQTLQALEQRRR